MNTQNPPARKPSYCWVITEDYIDPQRHSPPVVDDVLVAGPRGVQVDQIREALRCGEPFAMRDDDDELYYKGRIYGNFAGHEPLDDYGRPNAGCTQIEYWGEGGRVSEVQVVAAPAASTAEVEPPEDRGKAFARHVLARLAGIRQDLKRKQSVVAEALAVSASAVSRLERGARTLSISRLWVWGQALGLRADVLLWQPLGEHDALTDQDRALLSALARVLPGMPEPAKQSLYSSTQIWAGALQGVHSVWTSDLQRFDGCRLVRHGRGEYQLWNPDGAIVAQGFRSPDIQEVHAWADQQYPPFGRNL